MKILIIRHAEPDYERDSVTEKGRREAEYLSERLSKMEIRDFYTSPLGRAKDSAAPTLKKMNRTATECEWLREFRPRIVHPGETRERNCWDWLPQLWTGDDRFYQIDRWYEEETMAGYHMKQSYDWVSENLDQLLAKYGYIRDGRIYRVEESNHDTIVLFCHFGVGCVMISHLIGVSPMVLWHGLCAAPSSVSTLVTEERRKGIASFRMSSYGDVSHLEMHGEPPSFAARFSECYEDEEGRLD